MIFVSWLLTDILTDLKLTQKMGSAAGMTSSNALRYTLLVLAGPDSQTPYTALQMAKSIIKQGYTLEQVFFYHQGVELGNALRFVSSDEINIQKAWQDFAKKQQLSLKVCISAALRRGVADADESQRYELMAANLADGFELVGLGSLVEATTASDRVISLGAGQ